MFQVRWAIVAESAAADLEPYLRSFGGHLRDTALSIFTILGTLLLPVFLCCLILAFLAWWQNRRLMHTFGWRSLLFTGWLGTPVHELSHALTALLFCHKIDQIRLFRPDPATGQLGYLRHSYNPRNPYAAVLGNAVIPIAPFFGGTAVILLLTAWLMPELWPQARNAPGQQPITAAILLDPSQWRSVAAENRDYVCFLWDTLAKEKPWRRWQFFVYAYAVFCVATHLAPSTTDFKNAWSPALLILFALFAVNLLLRAFRDYTTPVIDSLWGPVVSLTGILTFAAVLSCAGAAAVTILTFILNRLK